MEQWAAFEERWRAHSGAAEGPLWVCSSALSQEPPPVTIGSGASDGRVTAALGREQQPVVFTSVLTGEQVSLRDAARTLGVHPVQMEQARAAVLDGLEQSERAAGRSPADRAPLPLLGERGASFARDADGRVCPEESAAAAFQQDWDRHRVEGFEVRWLGMNNSATGADVQIVHAGGWVTASFDSDREPEMTVKSASGGLVDPSGAAALLRRPEDGVKEVIEAVADSSALAWMEHGSAMARREAEQARGEAPSSALEPGTVRDRNRGRMERRTRCGIQGEDPTPGGPGVGRRATR